MKKFYALLVWCLWCIQVHAQTCVVNAGNDTTVCGNQNVPRNATASGSVISYHWTSNGTGTFSPSSTVLHATYIPAPGDYGHTVTVTLKGFTTTDSCSDNAVLTLTRPPVVDAGSDQLVCHNINIISMSGFRTGGTGQLWTTSGTGTFSNNTVMNPAYIFSPADKVAGQVTLIITSTGNGVCAPSVDSMTATYLPEAIADAGPDQTVCGDRTGVQLNGTITGAPGAKWTFSGSGAFLPSDTILNPIYVPSPPDLDSGSVLLILVATGNNCSNEPDTMVLSFIPAPQVEAGPGQNVCIDSDTVFLSASAINTSSIQWQTSGTGNFFPNDTVLTANYLPSLADKASGSVTLFLTGQGSISCSPDSSNLTLQFVSCPDTCTSQLSFTDSLSGKTIYADGFVTPGKPGNYQWNFGDGTILYGQSVSHTYVSPGTYQVCVFFTSADSLCHLQFCKNIQVKKCYVSVTFTKQIYEDSVVFSAITSPATPGEYFWDFGDGVIGKGQNVSHVYNLAGSYPVTLSFYSSDNTCVCEAVFSDTIKIKTCPKIYFDQTLDGTTVTLTAVSNTAASGIYYWDFGDGTYATGTTVIHHYAFPGTYTVLLEFFSHNGTCQCLCHSEFTKNVKVSNCQLQASFTDSTHQNTVSFKAQPQTGSSYYWNFGDGILQQTGSYVISHTYEHSGTYIVSLTVVDFSNPFDTCTASVTDSVIVSPGFAFKSAYITVHPNPAAETLNYSFDEETSITAESVEVLNGMGTVVKKAENVTIGTEGNTLELDQLPPGLYVIKITSSGKLFSKQFLKN